MKIVTDFPLLILGLVLAATIFAADVVVVPELDLAVAYVGIVLLSARATQPSFANLLAALATMLVIAAKFITFASLTVLDISQMAVAIAIIWLAAYLCRRLVRRRAAADHGALEETGQRYRSVFNQTFQFAAVLSPDGTVEEMNETVRALASSQSADFTGMAVWDLPLWDGDGREELRRAVASAASGNFFRDELRVVRSGQEDMIVDLSLKPIRDDAARVDLIILEARDITQHKIDQALLVQAQKLEVLGQFASGIAHDFNNILTVIAGNLELVERRVRDNEVVAQRVAKAVDAVFQGRKLTDRILTFARKRELEPYPVDVKSLIVEAIELSQSGLDENTEMVSKVAPNLWPCWADPTQLQTAILNLLINARDAMPNGGRITVEAANISLPIDRPEPSPDLPDGDYVILGISDEGEGIPGDIMDKVMDPFFSTKEPGEGSGLGLSMVGGFVKQSGGDLTISSKTGEGTIVRLYLPRSTEPAESPRERPETSASRGVGRILVVDDDGDVLDAAVSMLSDLGYEVDEARDSEQALALLRQGDRFDLLLTDVIMPGMQDGRELGRLARTILPDLKIIYSSANPERIAEIRTLQAAGEDIISKPYHYSELARKTEALLAKK